MHQQYCTLYLVRHGESKANKKEILQGQGILLENELSENGVAQAKEAAEKLRHIHFDAVYSSDLLRAKQTAEIITLEKKLAITTTEAIRERSYGMYEGMVDHEFEEQTKALLEVYKKLSEQEQWNFKYHETYESDEEVAIRFIRFLREVSAANIGKTILIASHGGPIRTFLAKTGFAPHKHLWYGTMKNTAMVKVRSDGVDFFIDEVTGVTPREQE